jgi:hypothetical protein
VGGGDGEAEEDGLARRAFAADEVGRDHRLAVAGAERVLRAEDEGDEQAEGDEAKRLVVLQEVIEDAGDAAAGAAGRGRLGHGCGRRGRAGSRHPRECGIEDVRRRLERLRGVVEERVAAVHGERGVDGHLRAIRRLDDDLLPAGTVSVVVVGELDGGLAGDAFGSGRLVDDGEPQHIEAALPGQQLD